MISRAAYIRSLRACGMSPKDIRAACVDNHYDKPTYQAINEALKPPKPGKVGRPRTKIHMVDAIRELLAAYTKARARVTITERMRNALNILEAQLEEYDAHEWRRNKDPLKY